MGGDVGDIEAVLDYLKRARSFDFTGYRRPTLVRRIDKRMEQVDVEHYGDYVDYLEVHPEEFEALFNTILINVSAFFRDPEAWDALRAHVETALRPSCSRSTSSRRPTAERCATTSGGSSSSAGTT